MSVTSSPGMAASGERACRRGPCRTGTPTAREERVPAGRGPGLDARCPPPGPARALRRRGARARPTGPWRAGLRTTRRFQERSRRSRDPGAWPAARRAIAQVRRYRAAVRRSVRQPGRRGQRPVRRRGGRWSPKAGGRAFASERRAASERSACVRVCPLSTPACHGWKGGSRAGLHETTSLTRRGVGHDDSGRDNRAGRRAGHRFLRRRSGDRLVTTGALCDVLTGPCGAGAGRRSALDGVPPAGTEADIGFLLLAGGRCPDAGVAAATGGVAGF